MEATSGVKDNMQQQVYDVEKDKTQEEQISCDCGDRLKDIQKEATPEPVSDSFQLPDLDLFNFDENLAPSAPKKKAKPKAAELKKAVYSQS